MMVIAIWLFTCGWQLQDCNTFIRIDFIFRLCILCNVLVWIFVCNILIPGISLLEVRKARILDNNDCSDTSLSFNLMSINSQFIIYANYLSNCLGQHNFFMFSFYLGLYPTNLRIPLSIFQSLNLWTVVHVLSER